MLAYNSNRDERDDDRVQGIVARGSAVEIHPTEHARILCETARNPTDMTAVHDFAEEDEE